MGIAWLVAGGSAACVGTVESGPAPSSGEGGDAVLGQGGSDAHEPVAEVAVVPAPPTLHRLRVDEWQNTVSDLLGRELQLRAELEPDTALKGFSSVGATELTIANTTAEKLEAAALEAVEQLFADPEARRALVGCDPTSADAACVDAFLARFGRRAFRRALAPEELGQMRALSRSLTATLGDPAQALAYATSAFLQSPHFVFRVELGEPDPMRPGRLRYTGYEMASRLSYVLWRSMPDEALLAAAEEGRLTTRDGLDREVVRMLEAPRFRAAMRRFFAENLSLDRLDSLAKEPALYPRLTPSLKQAMRGELLRRFDHVVFEQEGDYRDLLDGRTTFVNQELAALYGLEGVTGDALTQVELPASGPRAGVLGSAALLAIQATASDTSPTRRGKFIRGQILCQEIPPPPEGTNFALSPADAARTMRERLAVHRERAECAGCHALMDPIGLAFEHFDGIGAYRADDRGLPIDPSGMLDGEPFAGPRELLAVLRRHPSTARCVARQLFRFATGHQETEGEEALIAALGEAFAESGYRLPALLRALVTSDGFRFASHAPEPGGP